jgi:NitT/TauT family transport system permease protein
MLRQSWLNTSQQISQQTRAGKVQQRTLPPSVGLIGSLLLLTVFWKLLVETKGYSTFILPAPEVVFQRLLLELQGDSLPFHTGITLIEALGGFSIAMMISLPLGYVLARAPRLERFLAPQIAATQAIPIVAVAPLIILWFGTGLDAKILVATLVTFFPILSSAIVAFRAVPREVREMASISGANRWQVLWYMDLPLSLHGLFGGIKTGLALATTGAVVSEFVSGRDGLGALINISRGLFDTPLMFVALLVLATITLTFYMIAVAIERWLIRWEL